MNRQPTWGQQLIAIGIGVAPSPGRPETTAGPARNESGGTCCEENLLPANRRGRKPARRGCLVTRVSLPTLRRGRVRRTLPTYAARPSVMKAVYLRTALRAGVDRVVRLFRCRAFLGGHFVGHQVSVPHQPPGGERQKHRHTSHRSWPATRRERTRCSSRSSRRTIPRTALVRYQLHNEDKSYPMSFLITRIERNSRGRSD